MNNLNTDLPSIKKNHERLYGNIPKDFVFPKTTLYEYLVDRNVGRLNEYAINYFDNQITYGEFFENINNASKALYASGVRKGDFVTIVLPSIPEAFYLFLGLSRLGAVANLVDPRYGVGVERVR